MTTKESQKQQNWESFLEEDLPFLINSHYEDTVVMIKKKLQSYNSSLEILLIQYPNFLTKIRYHLFFWFAHQLSSPRFDDETDYYSNYCTVSMFYRSQYVYSFVKQQLEEQKVQKIISSQHTINLHPSN